MTSLTASSKEKISSSSLPLAIILLGPPGAGKGTHAPSVGRFFNIPQIATGDLFRDHIRRQTELGLKVKSLIDKGHLVPDDLVADLVFDRISQEDCSSGILLDGFPRTKRQAEMLDHRILKTHDRIVIYFHVPLSSLVERITGRLSCKQCGRIFHKIYDPPRIEGVCSCGHLLFQRSDDTEEVVKKRLDIYQAETEPVIDHYRKQEEVFFEIDGSAPKEEVLRQILSIMSDFHL